VVEVLKKKFFCDEKNRKGDKIMKTKFIPLFRASSIVFNRRTIFYTLNKKIVIEAPGNLMRQLIELCDGTRTNEEIINAVRKEWDENSVRGFLNELFQREILVDVHHLGEEIWKAVKNPMLFSINLSEEKVVELVQSAPKRHCSDICERFFSVELSFFGNLLAQRRSVRSFSGESVTLQSVINILWSAYGEFTDEKGHFHKVAPSAGALYPILIHLVLFNKTSDLDPAVYLVHYNQNGEVGLSFVSGDVLRFARSFLNPAGILKGIQGVIVISGSFSITGEKYGNRSMLYVPLEAGHVAQNILLEANIRQVATLEIGGFVDELLEEAIDLPEDYKPLTTIAFGKEATTSEINNTNLTLEVDWAIPMSGEYRLSFAMASARVSSKRSWSHGRDPSPNMALTKAISEAKEWAACGCIPELVKARFDELESAIDPRDVIKFYPSQYRVKGFPFAPFDVAKEYKWTKGYEVVTGSKVSILADHVYFPYFPETQYYAYANSSGCAAHPDRRIAIETGTLELVERDSFMNLYLTRLMCPTVAHETLPEEIQKRIDSLWSLGFKVWVKDHSLDLAPVVLVFAQSDELTFTTCASCSSFDIGHAVSHALMEVEASIVSRLQNGQPVSIKPREVEMPLDHGRIYGQKQYYRRANFLIDGGDVISFEKIGNKVARTWSDLLDRFTQKEWRLLVVPLYLSDEYGGNDNLHIVRCIVPGMVPMTFGYRQEPADMKRIYTIAKEFGDQTLSYGELTKFPHLFE